MSYSDFTLASVVQAFDLAIAESINVFATIPEYPISPFLTETLRRNLSLAIASNSEKARSEMIIAPILVELREQLHETISLFSGIDFTVQPSKGLNGICDFIISRSPELLQVRSPIAVVVEAKKENLNAGLGQCIAEMVAAQLFNQHQEPTISTIYGAVTSGTNWRFLKLQDHIVTIDLDEYYLADIDKILGILISPFHDPLSS